MPRENKTRFALLGMLSYQPMSGYDMKKMSDHSIGHFWNENFGNIYPVLKKMSEEGLVTMTLENPDEGPSRKVYSITEKGRKELMNWLKRPAEPALLREEMLLQVFFGQWADPNLIIQKIRDEDKRCREIIGELNGISNHLKAQAEEVSGGGPVEQMVKEGTPYWMRTVEYGMHFYAGIRAWCAESIMALEERKDENNRIGGKPER